MPSRRGRRQRSLRRRRRVWSSQMAAENPFAPTAGRRGYKVPPRDAEAKRRIVLGSASEPAASSRPRGDVTKTNRRKATRMAGHRLRDKGDRKRRLGHPGPRPGAVGDTPNGADCSSWVRHHIDALPKPARAQPASKDIGGNPVQKRQRIDQERISGSTGKPRQGQSCLIRTAQRGGRTNRGSC